MAGMAEQLVTMLQDLIAWDNKEQLKSKLGKVKTLVRLKPGDFVNLKLEDGDLQPLLNVLVQEDTELSHLAAETLEGIININDEMVSVITRYHNYIKEGLRGSNDNVLEVSLRVIIKLISNFADRKSSPNEAVDFFQADLVASVAALIGHEELKISEKAALVLRKLGNTALADVIVNQQVVKELEQLHNRDSTVRFRVYDLLSKVCCQNNRFFNDQFIHAMFSSLIKEVESKDDLAQMVALEILSSVASSGDFSMGMISGTDFLTKVKDIFITTSKDPGMGYLFCAAMMFFGSVGRARPSLLINDYPEVVTVILKNGKSDDQAISALCCETIANICHSNEGLLSLQKKFDNIDQFMHELGHQLDTILTDVYLGRLLDSLAQLFGRASITEEVSFVLKGFYSSLSQKPLKLIQKLCSRPVREVKLSALRVLRSIAPYDWSQEEMMGYAGFLDYLLNRDTEHEKEGRDLKYEIMKALYSSPSAVRILGMHYYSLVEKYVREGPFHSQRDAAVSFEKKD